MHVPYLCWWSLLADYSYGENCTCNCEYQSICNGSCNCEIGKTNGNCTEDDKFGVFCNIKCECTNGTVCNITSGDCLCLFGFTGETCTTPVHEITQLVDQVISTLVTSTEISTTRQALSTLRVTVMPPPAAVETTVMATTREEQTTVSITVVPQQPTMESISNTTNIEQATSLRVTETTTVSETIMMPSIRRLTTVEAVTTLSPSTTKRLPSVLRTTERSPEYIIVTKEQLTALDITKWLSPTTVVLPQSPSSSNSIKHNCHLC